VVRVGETSDSPARDAWIRFAEQSGLPIVDEAVQVAGVFAPELERYAELIRGPGGDPVGLMVRGEGETFSDRAQSLMRSWGMPDEGIAHYLALANLFEHRRAFLKLEWRWSDRRSESGQGEQIERLAAFYFRRRPSVRKMLEYYRSCGVSDFILERLAQLARLLDKDSIHFVSGAMRPGHDIRHKLYFSQYLTPDRHEGALRRLGLAMEAFVVDQEARAQVGRHHAALAPANRTSTVFVSASFGASGLVPSVKIDYPEVPPGACVALLPRKERAAALGEIQGLCRVAGTKTVSYLGVRLNKAGPVSLKYYVDLQANRIAEQPE
jgi:hypothetical protein